MEKGIVIAMIIIGIMGLIAVTTIAGFFNTVFKGHVDNSGLGLIYGALVVWTVVIPLLLRRSYKRNIQQSLADNTQGV